MRKFTKSVISLFALCCLCVNPASAQFSPELNFGMLMHSYIQTQQSGYGSYSLSDYNTDYDLGVGIQRMRLMFDAQLTSKDYFYVSTEINATLGTNGDKGANMRILDVMYEHTFNNSFKLSAGKLLAAYNRNNIQAAATLLANDFGTFQCEWNSVMQCDAGRDIGINLTGGFFDQKLSYTIGAFLGRDFSDDTENTEDSHNNGPLRYVGRLQYDFLDRDKFAGSNLGEGKTFTIGAGFDTQGSYISAGIDAYLDMPLGASGSLTANLAYSAMSGGDESDKYYVDLSARDIYFLELGYYFKNSKLQPWVKYELMSERHDGVNDAIYGGGLSYFFNGHNTNLKLGYSARKNSVLDKTYSQIQLQFQMSIF